jgi:hypothetical protein
MSDPANRSFAASPDDPAEHAPEWHQYGILTHSAKFGDALAEQIPAYARQWGVADPVDAALAVEIDGLAKRQLLQIVALVHDVGKFTARTVRRRPGGSVSTSFTGHERDSGRIVRNDLAPVLSRSGLGAAHIEYVATCAELHFELGKVRRTAKDAGGYTIAAERRILEEEISVRGLHPKLISQALQQPVNLAVARHYLRLWAGVG